MLKSATFRPSDMQSKATRRKFIATSAGVGALGLAGCFGGEDDQDDIEPGDDTEPVDDTDGDIVDDTDDSADEDIPEPEPTYEIWGLDQGTDTGYIYTIDDHEEPSFELVDTIDFRTLAGVPNEEPIVPHMIDFSSDYEYAAVACTNGARTLVFRTEDRELVGNIETGPSSHFAGFGPNDDYIQVDVIGDGAIVRIDADLDAEEFEIVDSIVISETPAFQEREEEFGNANPICHQYTDQGYSYHTLGPGVDDSGLVILDIESFEIAYLYSPAEVRSNCGTISHPTDDKFYLTAGAPSNRPDGGVGEWFVFDTETNRPIDLNGNVIPEEETFENVDIARDANGYDTHGFWIVPDNSELWILNRETHNGLVVDPSSDEVIDEIQSYGPAPDILAASPEGDYIFASLRGPNPVSGDPHAAEGETPGFSVIDIESREVVTVVEPDPEDEDSDFHGIGVRSL